MKTQLFISLTVLVSFAAVFAQDESPPANEPMSILETIRLQDALIIWFAGMLGGVANSLLDREGWKSILIPNLVLGGIAALIFWVETS